MSQTITPAFWCERAPRLLALLSPIGRGRGFNRLWFFNLFWFFNRFWFFNLFWFFNRLWFFNLF